MEPSPDPITIVTRVIELVGPKSWVEETMKRSLLHQPARNGSYTYYAARGYIKEVSAKGLEEFNHDNPTS